METFWKAAAIVLITVILGLALGKQEKDIATVLTLTGCCILGIFAVSYLEPVLDLLRELESVGQLQSGMLGILLKAVGIALTAEISAMICSDAGSNSLGKTLQMLGSAVIVYLSIPIFQAFLTLIREILGQL